MKKIIFATLVVLAATSVSAQDIPERKADRPVPHDGGGHKGMRKQHGIDMKALNLTDAQKEQMKTNREEFRKKMEELKKNENITVKEQRTRMEQLHKEQKDKMDKILTNEQKEQMKKMREDGQAKHKEMMDKRAAMMKERLNLTDKQAAELDKNRTEMAAKMRALREDKNLSDEQRKEKAKELMKQQKEAMKSILTEEQLKKLKENRHHGPHPHKGDTKTDEKKVIV